MEILFEDHHYIAVNKPAPLLTQGPPAVPNLEVMVKEYIKVKYAKPGNVYLGIPHRLDRPVSGVVLFARNTKAAHRVAVQFQEHTVRKIYFAIVEGRVDFEDAEWVDTIRKIPEEARSEPCSPDAEYAKEAITHVICRKRFEATSLIELRPKTGRMHQLRLQSSLRGHPIVGDRLYGSVQPFCAEVELPRDRIVALHACRLHFQHPFRQVEVVLEAGLPDYWHLGETIEPTASSRP